MHLYYIEHMYSKVKVLSGIITGNFCYHFYSVLINTQLNFNTCIWNTDISNTMDISKLFESPNHLIFKYFTLDISNTLFLTSF